MICFKRSMTALLGCFLLLYAAGCGYNIGARGMMHPQIKTIALGNFQNDTPEPLAVSVLKQMVAESFQVDGALDLKPLDDADCIIHAKILQVTNVAISTTSYDRDATKRPSEFTLTVAVEFSVIIPGRGEVLVPTRAVTGSAKYQYLADPAISRSNALKQACFKASQKIVEYTTEAW